MTPLAALSVYLPIKNQDQKVGTLLKQGSQYKFFYTSEFKESGFPPLVGFSELDRVYKSDFLFTFFQVRIPPFKRADVKSAIDFYELDATDTISVLLRLASRSVSSPYILKAETTPVTRATT